MQRISRWLVTISFLLCSGQVIAEEALGISKTQPATGHSVKIDGGYMVPYQFTIPGTDATVEMVPIPGGTFKLGSPASEKGHTTAEAPQVTIVVQPFWMAKHETTWKQYDPFLELYELFKNFEAKKIRKVNDENRIDAITAPTQLYAPRISYEYGEDPRLPATLCGPAIYQMDIRHNRYSVPIAQRSGMGVRCQGWR